MPLIQLNSHSILNAPKSVAKRRRGQRSLLGLLLLLIVAFTTNPVSAAPPTAIPPGYSTEIIQVKFREDSRLSPGVMALPANLRSSVARMERLFSLPEQTLAKLRGSGVTSLSRSLPNLNLWFQIRLKPGSDADSFIQALERLDTVEIVEPAPLPVPPPAQTPDFSANQGYLSAAPDGIGARHAWTVLTGNGSGVTIYDVEYGWNQTHEDLSKVHGLPLLLNPGDSNDNPFDDNHGTAVLGMLVADNDTKGVTGIAWGAGIGLAPANTTDLGYNVANAIILAVAAGSAGDVILLEQQATVCNLGGTNYGPVEWVSSVFNAIQTATANGFIVVEAAGNGNVNLDQAACNNRFNRSVRDSQAIIVGAGGSPGSGQDRQRLSFSSYGSRVDVQGWGRNVMTTGPYSVSLAYVNADDPTNPNFWYGDGFSGTSSGSAMIAGVVADLQGIGRYFGKPLTSTEVRTLLVQTGTPQLGNTAEHIGPRPDLRQVFSRVVFISYLPTIRR